MYWEATWEICTRVRVRIGGGGEGALGGSRQHALSGTVCPSLNHHPASPSALTPAPRRETTRGWRTFIPDVGRCQLTRSAPRSRGTEGVWGMIFVLGTIPSIMAHRRVRALLFTPIVAKSVRSRTLAIAPLEFPKQRSLPRRWHVRWRSPEYRPWQRTFEDSSVASSAIRKDQPGRSVRRSTRDEN